MKNHIKKIIPILFIIPILLNGCGYSKSNEKEIIGTASAPREVFIFAGKVQVDNCVNLASKISPSKATKVNVQVGSKVNAGDPIVYLDITDLKNQQNQAEAKVNTAKAALDKVQSKARPEDISIAEAAVDNDNKIYENAFNNYNRIKKLYDTGNETKQNLEQMEATLNTAKNKLASDKSTLDKLNNGAAKEDIASSEALVNEAQASVNSAVSQINNGIITSPISGTVSECNIHVGEIAETGVTLVKIVGNNQLYIDGYAPENVFEKIKVGKQVVIKSDDMPDKRFKGEISIINPILSSSGKNLVRVTLKEGNDILKPGMITEIGFKE
ncbi:HlyD family secretion protein [Clostridium scatologenes]|uniref:Secretion protein HlyD family protein n=1 Tax=Clostridium scatologenes TaxID=1548 RepID=A0A0E3M611_CLOSL|nr:efflux RND transporter periplasmic adaptor subunit [Clostridium scatologenes]AKA68807.1 secretion protein HlyD family protein [Clostridium scatologenes]